MLNQENSEKLGSENSAVVNKVQKTIELCAQYQHNLGVMKRFEMQQVPNHEEYSELLQKQKSLQSDIVTQILSSPRGALSKYLQSRKLLNSNEVLSSTDPQKLQTLQQETKALNMYMEIATSKGVPLGLGVALENKFKELVNDNIHVGLNTYGYAALIYLWSAGKSLTQKQIGNEQSKKAEEVIMRSVQGQYEGKTYLELTQEAI